MQRVSCCKQKSYNSLMNDIYRRLVTSAQKKPLLTGLRFVYLAALIYVIVFWRAIWTPDLLFFMFLGICVLYGKGRQFLFKFGPFVVLLLAYDSLRSIAPFLNSRVNYWEMIHFDRFIAGGELPTVILQQWWYNGSVSWFDYYFYLLYMCHFLVPVIAGLIIWKYRESDFNRFVVSFVVLSYAAFITYVLFPAAPPWMASELGLIPNIHKISTDIWWSLGVTDFPSLYRTLSPNLVAAVPSLHSAYPLLISIFVFRGFGKKWGTISLIYPISIWIGIVYMGEHYVFDIVVGVAYVFMSYFFTLWFFKKYGKNVRKHADRAKSYAKYKIDRKAGSRSSKR